MDKSNGQKDKQWSTIDSFNRHCNGQKDKQWSTIDYT